MYCAFNIGAIEKSVFTERRAKIDQHGQEGHIYELKSPDGIHFGYYNVTGKNTGVVAIANQSPYLQLSFNISGVKSYNTHTGQTLLSFEGNQYNLLYLNRQEIQLTWHPDEKLETFELGLSLSLLQELLPGEHPLYTQLFSSQQPGTTGPVSSYNLPLPATIRTILYDMLNCQLPTSLKQMYIKAKVIELLALHAVQHDEAPALASRSNQYLKRSEIEKMHLVKSIIHDRFAEPCTLIDLAHQVGTNETYLKQHFKQVFGDTVFGYMQQIKMNAARDMLMDGKSVQEVAGKMGYKHAAHFTRAFKKHLGYQPRKIKQSDVVVI